MDDLQWLCGIPYKPIKYFNGNIPQYDLYDVCRFGEPELWGIVDYEVLDNFEISRPLVIDWGMEEERRGSLNPIHHYSQLARFESTLKQLLGGSRKSGFGEDLLLVVEVMYDQDPKKVWDSVRSILKTNGWQKYYNRIPSILRCIGYKYVIKHPNWSTYNEIVQNFKDIVWVFNHNLKYKAIRKYFLNFRYVALKLMMIHGVEFGYHIPLLRTARIEAELNMIFESILDDINNKVLY